MSVQAITWAYAQTGLTGTQKFVLVTMANFADPEGRCRPLISTLMRETGLADRTVRRALTVMEGKGLIHRDRQRTATGALDRYDYTLRLGGRA